VNVDKAAALPNNPACKGIAGRPSVIGIRIGKTCAAACLILFVSISAGQAKCKWPATDTHPELNDSANIAMTCDLKGVKHARNPAAPGDIMTKISIVSPPHNGMLRVWGRNSWSYIPKSAGSDSFSFTQCAVLGKKTSGCGTRYFDVTIE